MRAGVFDPSPRDVEFLRAMYASEVSFADHYIGQLLGYMAQNHMLDNTIVVLTADHGEQLGERGGPWPEGDFWLHGDDLYDDGIRVPLIVFDPRNIASHVEVRAPVQHIDIVPTLLDLIGIPQPRQVMGRSITPLITGREDGTDRFVVTTLGDDRRTSIVAGDGWKLIVDRVAGANELYYLPDDPNERNNVAAVFPGRARAMAQRLDAWAQGLHTSVAAGPGGPSGG
jgi:arylsulfatase A-like enzyme